MTATELNVTELHIGSNVFTSQGEKVGKLLFIMVDPESRSVSNLVVSKGMMLSEDTLIPVSAISHLLHRGVFLQVDRNALQDLETFEKSNYISNSSSRGNKYRGNNKRRSHNRNRSSSNHRRRSRNN